MSDLQEGKMALEVVSIRQCTQTKLYIISYHRCASVMTGVEFHVFARTYNFMP